jgi:hypothetical protein
LEGRLERGNKNILVQALPKIPNQFIVRIVLARCWRYIYILC